VGRLHDEATALCNYWKINNYCLNFLHFEKGLDMCCFINLNCIDLQLLEEVVFMQISQ